MSKDTNDDSRQHTWAQPPRSGTPWAGSASANIFCAESRKSPEGCRLQPSQLQFLHVRLTCLLSRYKRAWRPKMEHALCAACSRGQLLLCRVRARCCGEYTGSICCSTNMQLIVRTTVPMNHSSSVMDKSANTST